MITGIIVKVFFVFLVLLISAVGFFCWLSVRGAHDKEDAQKIC